MQCGVLEFEHKNTDDVLMSILKVTYEHSLLRVYFVVCQQETDLK